MKPFFEKIKDKNGSGSSELMVGIYMLLLVTMLFIQVLSVFVTGMNLHSYAAKVVRHIEIKGVINEDTKLFAKELSENYNLADITNTYDKTGKLQLGSAFVFTTTTTVKIANLGSFFSIDIPIGAKVKGISEVYHK